MAVNIPGGATANIVGVIGLKGLSSFNQGLDQAGSKATKIGSVLKAGLAVGIAAAGAAFGHAVKEAAGFETKMLSIGTLLGKGSEAQKAIVEMESGIKALAKTMPTGAGELADAMYNIVSATVPAADAMKVLEISAKTATAGLSDSKSSFDLISAAIKGYGKDWSEAGKVSDIFFNVVKQGVTTIPELASSLQKVIPVAANLGISLENLGGLTSTLTGVTGNTAEVTTQLTSVMSGLMKPTGELEKAFERLGVKSGKQLIKTSGGLVGALNKLKKYTGDYDIAITKLLGRKESQLAYMALTGAQADDYVKKVQSMYEATGSMQDAFDIQMSGFTNQMKSFKNSINVTSIEIGQKLMPYLKAFAGWLNKNSGTISNVIKEFFDWGMIVGSVLIDAFLLLWESLKPTVDIIANDLIDAVSELVDWIDQNSTSISTTISWLSKFNTLLNTFVIDGVKTLGKVIAVVVENVEKMVGWFKDTASETFKDNVDKLGKSFGTSNNEGLRSAVNAVNDSLSGNEGLEGIAGKVKKAIGDDNSGLVKANKDAADKTKTLKEKAADLMEKLKGIKNDALGAKDSLGSSGSGLAKALSDNSDQAVNMKNAANDLNNTLSLDNGLGKVVTDLQGEARIPGLGEALEGAKSSSDDLKDSVSNLTGSESLGKVDSVSQEAKSGLEKISDGADAGTISVNDMYNILGDMINQMPGLSTQAKTIGTTLLGMVTSGFNPATVATGALTLGMSLFNQKAEKVPLTIDDVRDSLEKQGIAIRDAEQAITDIGDELTDKLAPAFENLLEKILAIQEHGYMFHEQDLENYKSELEDLTKIVAALEWPLSFMQGFDETHDLLSTINNKTEEFLNNFTGPAADFAKAGFGEGIRKFLKDAKLQILSLKEGSERWKDLNDEIIRAEGLLAVLEGKYESLEDYMKDQGYTLEDLTEKWEDYWDMLGGQKSPFNEFISDVDDMKKALGNFEFFGGDLAELEKNFQPMIQGMLDYLNTLDPNSEAYKQAKAAIQELITKMQELKDDAQGAAGENDDEGVKALQNQLKILKQNLENAQTAYTNLETELENKLMIQAEIQAELDKLGDERDQLINQLNEMEAEHLKIQAEIKLEMDELTGKQGDLQDLKDFLMTGWTKGEAGLTDYLQAVADLLGTDIESVMKTGGMDFYALDELLESLTGKTQTFSFEWESMIKKMTGDFSQFGKDMDTATQLLQDILFFNIDLDSTDADEAINALIFKMEDYLATLDPDSDAYKEFKNQLDDLKQKFLDAGGALDFDKALKFKGKEAEDGIGEIDGMLKKLQDKYDQNELKFIANTKDIHNKLKLIEMEINKLQDKKIKIDADIKEAQEKLKALAKLIAKLKGNIGDIGGTLGKVGSGVGKMAAYHTGAVVTAHTGLLTNEEVMIKALKNEVILPRRATDKFGRQAMGNFIQTLNPNDLKSPEEQQTTNVNIVVHEANPDTWVEIVDSKIFPLIQEKQRHYQPTEDKYKK